MKAQPSSTFVRHVPCSKCGSDNNGALYDDGHVFCHVCQVTVESGTKSPTREARRVSNITPLTTVFRAIPRRGLTEEAIKKFGIDVCLDKSIDVAHRYPYYKDGHHVANKVRRRLEKNFYWEGDDKAAELFGQSLFPAGSAKSLTIVEGELDAPSAWLLTGSRYPVVSVKNAATAVKDIKTNYEYVNSFDEIVICFDKDEAKTRADGSTFYPGQDAALKVAELFQPGKCRILTLGHGKDPNDYRQKGIDPKIFVKEWWDAPRFSPVGLKTGDSMWDEISNRPSSFAIPYPWEPLNDKTYGIRTSEAVLIMADTGSGKTTVFKEIEHAILTNPDAIANNWGVGLLHLEEPNFDTALGLMSIEANKPFHLPDTPKTNEELRTHFDKVVNTDRLILYDHFGSNDINEILAKVRQMSVMGCKYIFIDHLSIIVSDMLGDERKQLDEISTKLKMLTMELDIAVFCVIHTNRQGMARGSAGPEKVANIFMSLHRDKKDPDDWRRNVLKIEIEKNRFSGRTGPCLWLFYREETGRLELMDDELIEKYESGGVLNDTDLSW